MKAVVFDKALKFVEDRRVPAPAENEALIRVRLAGICNTDIEITRGYGSFRGIIGHEFVGRVEKINGPDRRLEGKRVVGKINCGCGTCRFCLSGLENHCTNRKVLGIADRDGAMAEFATLPVRNLLEVPDKVSDEEAVFTEPLAAAFEIPDQVHIRSGDRVLVMGDGKLGLLVSLVINLFHRELAVAGRHDKKLAIAGKQGIRTISADGLKTAERYDIVVDATGSPDGFESALRLVNPRGTLILKSTMAARKDMNLSPIAVNEITVVGSRCGPFEPALKALSDKRIDVRALISGIFPFAGSEDAFAMAQDRDALKVLIDFR